MVADEKGEVAGDAAVSFQAEFQGVGLRADGAEAVPLVQDHLFEQYLFGVSGGLVFAVEIGDEAVELFAIFIGDENDGAAKSVRETIAGGAGFAGFGRGASAFLRVLAIRVDLGLCGHVSKVLSS